MKRLITSLILLLTLSLGVTPLNAQGLMPPVLTSGAVSLTAATSSNCTSSTTACAYLAVSGLSHVYVQVTGTFSGTFQFETSIDNTNWVSVSMFPASGTQTAVTSVTSAGIWSGIGTKYARVRCSTYTSGTAVVTVYAKSN